MVYIYAVFNMIVSHTADFFHIITHFIHNWMMYIYAVFNIIVILQKLRYNENYKSMQCNGKHKKH